MATESNYQQARQKQGTDTALSRNKLKTKFVRETVFVFHMTSEVLTAVEMLMDFWFVTPCEPLGRYRGAAPQTSSLASQH
jgi:hypothetical protein